MLPIVKSNFSNSQLAHFFRRAITVGMGLAIFVHVILVGLFFQLEISTLWIYNLFSCVFFVSLYFWVRRDKKSVNIIFLLASVEIIFHALLATYYVGVDSGFYFFIWVIVPLMPLNRWASYLTMSVFISFLAIVQILVFRMDFFQHPVHHMNSWISDITYQISTVAVFITMVIVVYFYRKIVAEQTLVLSKESTLRQEINHKLEEANKSVIKKNSELERFSSVVAHDIKSPLNNISELIDLMKIGEQKLDESNTKMLDMIKTSSDQLQAFVSDLFVYSQAGGGRVEVFSVGDFLNSIVAEQSVMPGVEINVNVEIKDHIVADKYILKLVLRNLIDNAVKYNDKEIPVITIRAFEDGSNYFFDVKDNGPGISDLHLDSIFELWKTTGKKDRYGEEGNGFGLAIVKKTIESIGGNITCLANSGEGVCFCFNVPKNVSI